MSTGIYSRIIKHPWIIFFLGVVLTIAVYVPGLSGGWLFDDFPNIVDNPGVHLERWSVPNLVNAALSSPSSDFKRPLASLSFAINYLFSGNDPSAMKLTNLIIHLLNGLAAFLFVRELLWAIRPEARTRAACIASLVAMGWLLLPINLTAVLYVVQRMESLANLSVLLGLWGYVAGRRQMVRRGHGLLVATGSVVAATAIGVLAKETAVMLPLYAALTEFFIFRGKRQEGAARDWRIFAFFTAILLVPMIAGGLWLLPGLIDPATWITRDFTLKTRLLSEARIIVDYVIWTIFPSPHALSFYHDDFVISQGLLDPPTTALSVAALAGLTLLSGLLRHSLPAAGLGIALYLGCHLLTGTVLPLELVYEHRNYFSSLGLILAVLVAVESVPYAFSVARRLAYFAVVLLAGLWTVQTFVTARAWGDPIALARELAWRGPESPRAQYELGRMYIIASHYDPASPFTRLAYEPLERAARLPGSAILPEQALIFMNSKMHLAIKDAWWTSMIDKLKMRPATIQDESALDALAACLRDTSCDFPADPLYNAFSAALSHDRRSPRLLAMYANFAWSTLHDGDLAIRVQREAVAAAPREAAYRVGLARYAIKLNDHAELVRQIDSLEAMNVGDRLEADLTPLRAARDRALPPNCARTEKSCAQ